MSPPQDFESACREILLADGIAPARAARLADRVDDAHAEFLARGSAGFASRMVSELSVRELEVLEAAAAGKPMKATAIELGVSISCVSEYRRRLLKKLRAATIGQAVAIAIRMGLVGKSTT